MISDFNHYKRICVVNKYLFGELEKCTLMHNYLLSVGGESPRYTYEKEKIRAAIDKNLKKLDAIWRTAKDADRDHEQNETNERVLRMDKVA